MIIMKQEQQEIANMFIWIKSLYCQLQNMAMPDKDIDKDEELIK